jgi:hypothetical protein
MQSRSLLQTETNYSTNPKLELIERWLRTLPGEGAKALEQALVTHDTSTLTRFRMRFQAWLQNVK